MIIVLVGAMILAAVALLAVASVTIHPSRVGWYELARRHKAGDQKAQAAYERMAHFGELLSLQQVVISFLLVVSTMLLMALLGWFGGMVAALALALFHGKIARVGVIHRRFQPLYDAREGQLIHFIKANPQLVKAITFIRHPKLKTTVHSRPELLDVVQRSVPEIISPHEQSLIEGGLAFAGRKVADVMVPRSKVAAIKSSEILGPLVLDDLHKTGYSRFPVIASSLDHVVGVLMLDDVLTIDGSRNRTAKIKSVMDPNVYYIHQSQTLEEALAAFLTTHHHLLVVVDESGQTAGILCLEDVITALFGRQLTDAFTSHDERAAVAKR